MSGRRIHPGPRSSAQRRGLTLLELLLALGLIMVIMGGVFAWYLTIQKTRKSTTESLRDVLMMRALLEQVANEVRQATDLVPGDGIGFSGDENRIVIVRLAMPEVPWEPFEPMRVDLPPPIVDLRRTTYELAWDEELKDELDNPICHGLVRNDQKTFDPNPRFVVQVDAEDQSVDEQGKVQDDTTPVTDTELFAPEIKYLKFEYFDGAEWRDRWQTEVAAQMGASGGAAGGVPGEDGSATGGGEEAAGGGGEAPPGGGEGAGGNEGSGSRGGAEGAAGGAGGGAGGAGGAAAGAGGGSVGGGTAGGGSGGYALPQAIRITIGKIPEPPEDLELDAEQLKEMKERREKEYHEDRFTAVVYLRQADQTLLSSRKHGVDNDLQMGEQTEGQ